MREVFNEVRKVLPEEFVTGEIGSLQEFINELMADYSLDADTEPPEEFRKHLWLILTAEYASGRYVFTLPGDPAKWAAASPGDSYSSWTPYLEVAAEGNASSYRLQREDVAHARPTPSRPIKDLVYVFHGTSNDRADSIIHDGFRPGVTSNGKRYGDGFYFTEAEKTARGWSYDEYGIKGNGAVIRARISGVIAAVDQPKVDKTVKNGDFSAFPFVESVEDEIRLRKLIKESYPNSGVSESAIGVFLKEKGYSAMHLSPWREIVVFERENIVDIQKI
ncbi:hypothetical protein ACIQMR_31450 [Streptomyces sp. NPDC091376]|uniref:hypothetical protein n=1 Tax=Streptomyces sp. NPDC091376 TaxID=3365994 RepID=UPI0038044293